jgi:hypothetical protein
VTRGKYKKHANARREKQAAAQAQVEHTQQIEYTARLEDAQAREAEARAALAQLLPGLLEGMSGQTEIAEIRKELVALRAENKRHWSALRATFLTFGEDFGRLGDPKLKINDKDGFLREDFAEAMIAIRDEGGLHAGTEDGRDNPNRILRKHQKTMEQNNK